MSYKAPSAYPIEDTHIVLPQWHGYAQSVFSPRLCDVLEHGYDLKLTSYPIWDESRRADLNQMIVDHFYMREIGAETTEMFVFFLNRTMREEMPRLNKLFIALDKLSLADEFETEGHSSQTVDGTNSATHTTDSEGHGNGTNADATHSDTTGHTHAVNSNAPQMNMQAVNNGEKADNYWNTGAFSDTDGTADGTDNSNYTQNNTDHSTAISSGTLGSNTNGNTSASGHNNSLTALMAEWRDNYTNPFTELFDALEPCFMQVRLDHVNGV